MSLTPQAYKLLEAAAAEPIGDGIPFLGRIAAGVPIDAIENAERISLSSEFGNSQDVFALRVVGSSMVNAGISDGDYVICKRGQTAENGKIVAAILDEENATVKRFYKEADRVRLEPENPDFEPIYTQNCRIAGVVIGLMRKI